jgi:hypothetical protein
VGRSRPRRRRAAARLDRRTGTSSGLTQLPCPDDPHNPGPRTVAHLSDIGRTVTPNAKIAHQCPPSRFPTMTAGRTKDPGLDCDAGNEADLTSWWVPRDESPARWANHTAIHGPSLSCYTAAPSMPAKILLRRGRGWRSYSQIVTGTPMNTSRRKLPAVLECKCLLLGRHCLILVASEGGDKSTDQESASVR